jgi:hypothetical protein
MKVFSFILIFVVNKNNYSIFKLFFNQKYLTKEQSFYIVKIVTIKMRLFMINKKILSSILCFIFIFSGCITDVMDHSVTEDDQRLFIDFFTVDSLWIIKDFEVNLSWSVFGANSVYIDDGIGNVSLEGSIAISPKETTTYTLTASNESHSLSSVVTVYVKEVKSPYPGPLSDEAIALTSQFESILSNVVVKDGYTCSLNMETTSFKLGEPIKTLSFNVTWQIPWVSNQSVCDIRGYYYKQNITTFSGKKNCGLVFGVEGPWGNWDAKPTGEYYYFEGIYLCEDIEKTLGKHCTECDIIDILVNVSPVVYDRIHITVSDQIIDCLNVSEQDLCYRKLATVTGDCSFCENIEKEFIKRRCFEEC